MRLTKKHLRRQARRQCVCSEGNLSDNNVAFFTCFPLYPTICDLLLLLNIFILLRYYSQLNGFDRRLSYLYHFAHILKLYHYIVHSHCTPCSHSSLFLDDLPRFRDVHVESVLPIHTKARLPSRDGPSRTKPQWLATRSRVVVIEVGRASVSRLSLLGFAVAVSLGIDFGAVGSMI